MYAREARINYRQKSKAEETKDNEVLKEQKKLLYKGPPVIRKRKYQSADMDDMLESPRSKTQPTTIQNSDDEGLK